MEILKTKEIVKGFFNNSAGEPFELTPGQVQIFNAVYDLNVNRVVVKATTQYGKSETVSLALIMLWGIQSENILHSILLEFLAWKMQSGLSQSALK